MRRERVDLTYYLDEEDVKVLEQEMETCGFKDRESVLREIIFVGILRLKGQIDSLCNV